MKKRRQAIFGARESLTGQIGTNMFFGSNIVGIKKLNSASADSKVDGESIKIELKPAEVSGREAETF